MTQATTATEEFVVPDEIAAIEKALLEKLRVDEEKINDIETKTRGQSNCEEWEQERKFRFTALNFGLISARKRNHDTFVNSLLHPKPGLSISFEVASSFWKVGVSLLSESRRREPPRGVWGHAPPENFEI